MKKIITSNVSFIETRRNTPKKFPSRPLAGEILRKLDASELARLYMEHDDVKSALYVVDGLNIEK